MSHWRNTAEAIVRQVKAENPKLAGNDLRKESRGVVVSITDSYSSKNIKVLTEDETIDRFPFLRADEIARKYNKPLPFVRRGLEACAALGVHENLYINRYLLKRTTEDIPGFKEVYAEIMKEARA